jgi:hypothetical protein
MFAFPTHSRFDCCSATTNRTVPVQVQSRVPYKLPLRIPQITCAVHLDQILECDETPAVLILAIRIRISFSTFTSRQ